MSGDEGSATATADPSSARAERPRGTIILLRAVLADLADGASIREILGDFPTLTEEQVRAAIAFAAAAARDDMPVPAVLGTR